VRVSLERAGEEVCLCVQDEGPGLAPDRLAAIGEAYAKLGAGERPSERGLGIGLTLVKLIATRHGGRVEVSNGGGAGGPRGSCSADWGGACVRIFLPLAPKDRPPSGTRP